MGIMSLVFLNHSLVRFDNAPDYDREDYGYSEFGFLNHSLVGFVNRSFHVRILVLVG